MWKELLIQDFEEMPNKQILFCYKTSVTTSPKRDKQHSLLEKFPPDPDGR